MNKEYISKDRVLEIIRIAYQTYLPAYHGPISFLESSIINEKPAEVREIIHAKWEIVDREDYWIGDEKIWSKTGKPTVRKLPVCSHCKAEFDRSILKYTSCPRCGAWMDLEDEE